MDTLIDAFLAARRDMQPVARSHAHNQLTEIEAGYACQDQLNGRLSSLKPGGVAGYKIGCTTPVMQEYLKIPFPCAGVIYQADLHHSPARVPHRDFVRPGIECEIAVTLAADMPSLAGGYNRENVGAHVASCHAAIEIVDDRYEDFAALTAATLIADNFFQAGEVLGPAITDWQDLDLAQLKGTVEINGIAAGAGEGNMILGHPLEALAWLANFSADRGRPLGKGHIVSLGSVVQTIWIDEPDTKVDVNFDDLGTCSVLFE